MAEPDNEKDSRDLSQLSEDNDGKESVDKSVKKHVRISNKVNKKTYWPGTYNKEFVQKTIEPWPQITTSPFTSPTKSSITRQSSLSHYCRLYWTKPYGVSAVTFVSRHTRQKSNWSWYLKRNGQIGGHLNHGQAPPAVQRGKKRNGKDI
jgi:hypothetical protein